MLTLWSQSKQTAFFCGALNESYRALIAFVEGAAAGGAPAVNPGKRSAAATVAAVTYWRNCRRPSGFWFRDSRCGFMVIPRVARLGLSLVRTPSTLESRTSYHSIRR